MSHRNATEALTGEAEATLPLPPSEDWAQLPWRKLEQSVYRLQKRMTIPTALVSWTRAVTT